MSLTPPNETISLIDGPAPTGYPIVNYEYAVVSTRQPTRPGPARSEPSSVAHHHGQPADVPGHLGFQPLPAALVTLGEQQIAEIGS